ncbi:hypothetical protein FRC02_003005 [Tulasnella sp. 418]|nr:hypothetical protein FRC02_003005 [Tulasnella sp. 418]
MSEAERLLHIASLPSPTSSTVPLGHSGPELKQLSLDSPTRSVLSILPTWVKSLKDSLQCLSISSSVDLTPSFLDSILSQLSNIKSLSIQNCTFISHADILRLTKHHFTTLESLTLTVHRNANENTDLSWPKLVSLKHLTINIPRAGMTTSKFESTVRAVLSVTSHSALESITFRNTSSKKPSIVLGSGGEASSGRALGPSVIEWVVRAHKSSLKKFNIINFKMGQDLVDQICKECKELRQLALNLDISSHQLSTILSRAPKLATLIDTQTTSGHGGENSNLTVHDVTRLFVENATTLTTIITSARTWTVSMSSYSAAKRFTD